ncbi:MAG: ABC transporter permease [Terriglobales bacterium]
MQLATGLHYAWRRAAKQRGLTVVLILALALGLGGATAILSLARHVLLNPLGLPQPQRVVHIYAGGEPATVANYSKLPAFAAVGGFHGGGLTATAGALHSHAYIASVTQGFFGVAGVEPRQGRKFSAEELHSGARVAIISQALRGSGFNGAAVGRSIQMGGTSFTVIGVMPARFEFPAGTSIWVPFNTARRYLVLQSGPLHGELVARLRPGATLRQADAQVKAEMEREVAVEEAANPGQKYGMSTAFAASSVKSWARGSRPMVDLLLAAAGLLWLVACFGVGGVLLARALGDQKELATRIALGGRRLRLAVQWCNEALIVIVPAAMVSVGVTTALMALLRRGAPASMLGVDLLHASGADWATLVGLAAVTLVAVAVPPALSTLRLRPPAEMLQSAFYGKVRTSVLWQMLVVAELAVALVLTAGAALLLSSYAGLTQIQLGFRPKGVSAVTYTTAPVLLSLAAQARSAAPAERKAIRAQMAVSAQAGNGAVLAAIQREAAGHAALVENFPFSKASTGGTYVVPAPGDWHHQAGMELNLIAGPYLRTLGLPLLRGRYFSPDDTATAPAVAIVSRGAAQALWGARNPVGRELYEEGNPKPITVVGETRSISAGGAVDDHFWKGQVYFPATQPERGPALVMTAIARGVSAGALTQAVSQVHGIELLDSTTLAAAAATILAPQRFSLRAMEMFSMLALLLIWLAVIGMLAHWVAGRRHEIAIRLALGASPAAMARNVLLRLGAMLTAAIGLGVLLSPLEKDVVGHLLVGVSALDARLWAAAALIVCLVALAAAAIPALRAARVHPADTLRYE